MMKRPTVMVWAVSQLLVGVWQVSGGEFDLSPRERVLALRNGHVLRGSVTNVGDYYIVTLGDQGEARVPAANVEMVCDSLEIVYFRKRDTVQDGDLAGHLELAEWCLRNVLPVRAADQILAAFSLAPDNPRVRQLEARLALQVSTISRDGGEAKAASVPASDPATKLTPSQISESAVLQFTQKVQPTLVNRCASNACHGARSRQQFQVLRPLRGQSVPYRMTVRNLQSALAFVDHRQPDQSPLLVAARTAHGGLDVPVFGQREAVQYEQLLAWVQMAATQRMSSPDSGGQAASAASSKELSPAGYAAPLWDATVLGPEPAESKPLAAPAAPLALAPTTPGADQGEAPDPFDPTVFNRQFVESP